MPSDITRRHYCCLLDTLVYEPVIAVPNALGVKFREHTRDRRLSTLFSLGHDEFIPTTTTAALFV